MLRCVEFFEAPIFTRIVPSYLGAEDYRPLQLHLARDPEAGDIIPGTGGFRKLRWADRRRRKGRRGGLRVIYYYLASDAQVWLMTIYDKDEAADLSPAERQALRAAIEEERRQRADTRRSRAR